MDQEQLLPLLVATAQGHKAAFASLYEHTSGQLYAITLKLLKRADLAEEALQDAYVQIWHKADSYHRGRGTVLTWMISIARYRALDSLRYHKVRPEHSFNDEIAAPDLSTLGVHQPPHEKLYRCLNELESEQRQAICLAYFNGLSHTEVVKHVDSPLGTVKSWIRRGLQSLQRCLSL